jgi:DNA-binding NarL/FixJ family response regulator
MSMSTAAIIRPDAADSAEEDARTFLIVDDSAVIRRRLVSLLTEIQGVRLVGEAADAMKGAELIAKLHPDVVILDIRMPNRSGIGLLESIKDNPNLPVLIILTNYPYAAYRKRCMELGASYFFDKSTEFIELERVVRELAEVGG